MLFATIIAIALQISAETGPVSDALKASEVPYTFRAAFTVELSSDSAYRTFSFDPRWPDGDRWRLIGGDGEDVALDAAASVWSHEASPDSRLFRNGLRAAMGQMIEAEDLGAVWRLSFSHVPDLANTDLTIWLADEVKANAWLDPATGRFLRLDYRLEAPVPGPGGGEITQFSRSYILETDPDWGYTYTSAFLVNDEMIAETGGVRRDYSAKITSVEFFYVRASGQHKDVVQPQETSGPELAER
ncbi:hypothetical protein [Henriciella litoralis]|uniref:hypothetical protein n=1 Tax=Henriciella litoralis TaxID=568102 RepID=UPI000A0001B8|nr:hypothetical protein [Henriciella litoralis]